MISDLNTHPADRASQRAYACYNLCMPRPTRALLVLCLSLSLVATPVSAEPPGKRKFSCSQFSVRMALGVMALIGAGSAGYHYYLKHQEYQRRLEAGKDLIEGDYDYHTHLHSYTAWAGLPPKDVEEAIRAVAVHMSNFTDDHRPSPRSFFKALNNLAVQDPELAVRFQKRGVNVGLEAMQAQPSRAQLEKALIELGMSEYAAVKAGKRPVNYTFKAFDYQLYSHAKRYEESSLSEEKKAKAFSAAEHSGWATSNRVGAYISKRLFESGKDPLTALKQVDLKVGEKFLQQRADRIIKNLEGPQWEFSNNFDSSFDDGDSYLNSSFQKWTKMQADKGITFQTLDEAIDAFIGN